MGAQFLDVLEAALGTGAAELGLLQVVLRAVAVYPLAIAIVRFGDKRLIGTTAAFDFLLAIIIGSVISRAITGNAPFVPAVATGYVLVLLHWAFAKLGFHVDWFGRLIKGEPRELVQDGEIRWDAMRRSAIGMEDLLSGCRRNGNVEGVEDVTCAVLERNGDISVVLQSRPAAR